MGFSTILDRFVGGAPLSVMSQVSLEYLFGDKRINGVFDEVSQCQYSRHLLFSTCTDLLVQVTLFGCPSVNAAFNRDRAAVPVSVVSVYKKLQGVEPAVCESLVQRITDDAGELIRHLKTVRSEPVPGLQLKIGDGNSLRRSERRLAELRGTDIAALPGRTVALYEYATNLVSRLVVSEDAHVSERKLMLDLLPHLQANDLFMADSSFATMDFFQALTERKVKFLMRHHGGLRLTYLAKRKSCGRCKTGKVYEQQVRLPDGQEWRAIIVVRDKPLAKGGRKVILLTSVPRATAKAAKLATLYLRRWTIEEAFRQLTQYLSCEVCTLGYPKAALLAFTLAVTAFNCLACVQAALAKVHGRDKVEELSMFYMGLEIKRTFEGMHIAVPAEEWRPYAHMSAKELAEVLCQIAKHVDWQRYQKAKRGPKKSKKSSARKKSYHVSTVRLLEKRQRKPKPR
jgi:Transposase DDE domain